MKRLRTLLGRSEFHILLFGLCLILFTRPLLVMFAVARPDPVMRSLYLPWAGIIILLFLVARSSTSVPADTSEMEEGKDGGKGGEVSDA